MTGFHHDQYPVCRECKQEVSPELREQKIQQRKDKEKRDLEEKETPRDSYDEWDLWSLNNGIDIFGDGGT